MLQLYGDICFNLSAYTLYTLCYKVQYSLQYNYKTFIGREIIIYYCNRCIADVMFVLTYEP